MTTSFLLAKVLGIIYVVLGVGVLVNFRTLPQAVDDFFKNTGLTFLGGLVTAIIGLVIIALHNVWQGHWSLIITILGWFALVKGAVLIIRPQLLAKATRPFTRSALLMVVDGCFILALGIFLAIMGFWA
jgi:hypothetical protein